MNRGTLLARLRELQALPKFQKARYLFDQFLPVA